ncbi:MAG: hypothetical protein QW445_07420 [Candidatus Bathyarchaeia archaeon]
MGRKKTVLEKDNSKEFSDEEAEEFLQFLGLISEFEKTNYEFWCARITSAEVKNGEIQLTLTLPSLKNDKKYTEALKNIILKASKFTMLIPNQRWAEMLRDKYPAVHKRHMELLESLRKKHPEIFVPIQAVEQNSMEQQNATLDYVR